MANIVELREKTDDQLLEMIEHAREELFNLRFQHASARLEDVSRLRAVRREIAQLETVLHMRELAVEAALQEPAIASAVEGHEWQAEANFVYEQTAWEVTFVDEDDKELAKTFVNLNKKKAKGRRARKKAQSKA
jgi:large subunit ribosomal protein L29